MTHNYSIKKNGVPSNPFAKSKNCLNEFRRLLFFIELLKKKWFSLALVLLVFNYSGFSQKQKDVLPYACVKYVGNGIYQASFGYENPTKKEIVIDENSSTIKTNNGKRVAKGLNKFKPGSVKNVFTREFGSKDYVEWIIISNGNTHSVIVNANSGVCDYNNGFIFPVYGQNNGKYENAVGPELAALSEGAAGDQPSDLIFQINDEKVLVEIIPEPGQMASVIALLQNTYSLIYDENNPNSSDFLLDPQDYMLLSAVDVYFPIFHLSELNEIPYINFVRPLYPAVNESMTDGFTGNSVSQGDETQNSKIVREAYRLIQDGDLNPVDGSGIKIGVISNSFDTQPYTEGISKASIDVKQGDLPGALNEHGYTKDVENRQEWGYGTASDEGRAMMHIIHDVAPGASLAFYSGSLSPRNFEMGFQELADCDIIVDDITFITEPFFGEGRMSALIKDYTAAGKMHFTSAGNFGNKGYQGVFNATDQLPVTNFLSASATRAHVFDSSSGDYLQKISVKGGETYMLVLQWADQVSASQNNENGARIDLDFFIVDDAGRLLVGNNRDNEAGDAAEVMVFTATADGEANIMITSANGENNIPFRYIAFKSNGLELLEYNDGTPTISGHAMTDESVTVGAIRFNKDEAESFSSFGGILSDGATLSVDMGAPDGVNTNVGSIGIHEYADGSLIDGDPFPNFFGTSAAAPSAAAAMALLQSALPVWYPDGNGGSTISSSQAIQLFKDNSKGSSQPLQVANGMIDVGKVFQSLASRTARITSFTIVANEDGSTPVASAEPIEIKLIGEFFPPAPPAGETYETYPIVYFNEEPIDYTVNEDGSILAYVPVFSGNPDLQIFTEAKPGSVNNGGFSDPIKILPDGKRAINVFVDDLVIKYGQDYLSRLSYTVEGIPEEGFPEGQRFEEYFPQIVYNSAADDFSYPDVNNYLIEASFGNENLTEEQMENYQLNFVNKGNLIVEKNNLNIKPLDQNLTYGDIVQNSLSYQLTDEQGNEILGDSDLYTDLDGFYAAIAEAHASDFYYDTYDPNNPESIMLLINGFSTDSPHYSAIMDLLEDGGWVSTENAILNGVIRQRGIMNDMRQSAVLNEFRQTNIMNDFRQSALMNTLRIDQSYFTDYIDRSLVNDQRQLAIMNDEWVSRTSNIMNDLRQTGVMNDFRQTAVMNDMRVGAIMNIIDIVDLNVDAVVNGQISRQLGVMNDLRQSAVMNGLRQSAIMNETGQNAVINDKIFSLIDYTDIPDENDLDREIQRFYAVNLLTGIDITGEGSSHYLFSGAFLNNMAANFNVHYDKAIISIQKAELLVNTVDFEVSYGTVMTDKDIPTTFSKTANYEVVEAIFPDGIPYYFKKQGEATEYTLDGDVKMDVGVYDVFIRDIADNYKIEYDSNHGKLTIKEAVLTVDATVAEEIKYGEVPNIDVSFTGFVTGEDMASVFPDSEGGIPFFFKKADDPVIYTIGGDEKMNAGVYDIFITDLQQDNYMLEFADDRGQLIVSEAKLSFVPVDLEINYGALPVFDPLFEGFAYNEGANVLEDEFGSLPYYFVKDGDMTIYTLGGEEKLGVGVYDIFITDNASDNYEFEGSNELGLLKVLPKVVNVKTNNLTKTYGDQISTSDLNSIFDSFAYDETAAEVFGEDGIPYYFTKEGDPLQYEPDGSSKMSVGNYEIRIEDQGLMNYILDFNETDNLLTIQKKELTVSIDNVIINQGEFPNLIDKTNFNGFVYNETKAEVFPDGISYYFVDENNIEQTVEEPGVYDIRIVEPENYVIVYINEAKIWINPFHDDIRKIRIYADCVSYNEGGASGLNYTVIFRYENDNDFPVFVFEGDKNHLSGTAYAGTLQTTFLPGSGTFEIQFDGNRLTWSLETYGSVNKTSVSSANNDGTGECEAKIDNTYLIYPNPVSEILNIEQQEAEVSEVFVLNMFGVALASGSFSGTQEIVQVDMTSFSSGMYIVRIVSSNGVNSYNILKE